MNRADRLHKVLADGRWHTRHEVFARVGYMLTNNAASELRARGIQVEHRKHRGNDEYRVLLEQPPVSAAQPDTALLSRADGAPGVGGCSSGALPDAAHDRDVPLAISAAEGRGVTRNSSYPPVPAVSCAPAPSPAGSAQPSLWGDAA